MGSQAKRIFSAAERQFGSQLMRLITSEPFLTVQFEYMYEYSQL